MQVNQTSAAFGQPEVIFGFSAMEYPQSFIAINRERNAFLVPDEGSVFHVQPVKNALHIPRR
jgi:hypothetical protein